MKKYLTCGHVRPNKRIPFIEKGVLRSHGTMIVFLLQKHDTSFFQVRLSISSDSFHYEINTNTVCFISN